MTCIVGLEHKGKVYMGGDSAGVSGLAITVRGDEKVFKNGPFLMGFTTSFRMGQILRYAFRPPIQPKGKSDMKFLVTDFVNAVRKAYKASGYLKKSGDQEYGGTFLLGYKSKLYCVDSDFQVGYSRDAYQAVGCGEDYALGAMHATEGLAAGGLDPKKRVEMALQAAAHFSGGVTPPFTILCV